MTKIGKEIMAVLGGVRNSKISTAGPRETIARQAQAARAPLREGSDALILLDILLGSLSRISTATGAHGVVT